MLTKSAETEAAVSGGRGGGKAEAVKYGEYE
jgi:hypothetical protein